jgi:hypothetical protein
VAWFYHLFILPWSWKDLFGYFPIVFPTNLLTNCQILCTGLVWKNDNFYWPPECHWRKSCKRHSVSTGVSGTDFIQAAFSSFFIILIIEVENYRYSQLMLNFLKPWRFYWLWLWSVHHSAHGTSSQSIKQTKLSGIPPLNCRARRIPCRLREQGEKSYCTVCCRHLWQMPWNEAIRSRPNISDQQRYGEHLKILAWKNLLENL